MSGNTTMNHIMMNLQTSNTSSFYNTEIYKLNGNQIISAAIIKKITDEIIRRIKIQGLKGKYKDILPTVDEFLKNRDK